MENVWKISFFFFQRSYNGAVKQMGFTIKWKLQMHVDGPQADPSYII